MSEVQMKIRVNELEPDDFFIKHNTTYRVTRIHNGIIYAKHPINHNPLTLGAKSMEFVLWTGKYSPKPKERKPPKPKKRTLNPQRPMIPIKVFSDSGEILGSYKSIKRAAEDIGIGYKYIERYVKKQLVKKKYPYHFEKILVT